MSKENALSSFTCVAALYLAGKRNEFCLAVGGMTLTKPFNNVSFKDVLRKKFSVRLN